MGQLQPMVWFLLVVIGLVLVLFFGSVNHKQPSHHLGALCLMLLLLSLPIVGVLPCHCWIVAHTTVIMWYH